MATYYVDDGGSSTSPYDTWAKAASSLATLEDAVSFANGDIIYIGHNSVDSYSYTGNFTFTAPSTIGEVVTLISATQGSDPPTYAKSSTNQVYLSSTYYPTFSGNWIVFGVRIKSGGRVVGGSQGLPWFDCTFAPAAGSYIQQSGTNVYFKNLTVDLSADSTGTSAAVFQQGYPSGTSTFDGLSFVSPGNRTGVIFSGGPSGTFLITVSGADFSEFTNATTCELVDGGTTNRFIYVFSNCKTKSPPAYVSTISAHPVFRAEFYNVANTDSPEQLYVGAYAGTIASNTSIYRTGGASVEGVSVSWLMTGNSSATELTPLRSPWIYGVLSATGSKTISVAVTNATADLTDAQMWLEVEAMGTANGPQTTQRSDWRGGTGSTDGAITTTAVNQTDDTTSTWENVTSEDDYMQTLSVGGFTVNEEGLIRARVCLATNATVYVDPKLTVA